MSQTETQVRDPTDQIPPGYLWLSPAIDQFWDEGAWIRCDICPRDNPESHVFHHKNFKHKNALFPESGGSEAS